MLIEKLQLNGFRNYEREQFEFSDGLNVLQGANAEGKTNVLEAVCVLSLGCSPRTQNDRDMIKLDAESARITAAVTSKYGSQKVDVLLSRREKKRATIAEMPVSRIGELMGAVGTVYFSPDELKMIKAEPSYRRKFMDENLCQLSKTYFYALTKYNKILRERNALLKCGNEKEIDATLSIWDAQLAKEGAKIALSRRDFTESVAFVAKAIHKELTDSREDVEIDYLGIEGKTEDEIENALFEQLKGQSERDKRLQFTSVGVQKDDIKIVLRGKDLRVFGSQGQQRTAALAMKLAEIEVFKRARGETPVLLLDDVLSELDEKRRERLLFYTKGVQTLLTCTEFRENCAADKIFNIKGGKISSIERLKG